MTRINPTMYHSVEDIHKALEDQIQTSLLLFTVWEGLTLAQCCMVSQINDASIYLMYDGIPGCIMGLQGLASARTTINSVPEGADKHSH